MVLRHVILGDPAFASEGSDRRRSSAQRGHPNAHATTRASLGPSNRVLSLVPLRRAANRPAKGTTPRNRKPPKSSKPPPERLIAGGSRCAGLDSNQRLPGYERRERRRDRWRPASLQGVRLRCVVRVRNNIEEQGPLGNKIREHETGRRQPSPGSQRRRSRWGPSLGPDDAIKARPFLGSTDAFRGALVPRSRTTPLTAAPRRGRDAAVLGRRQAPLGV